MRTILLALLLSGCTTTTFEATLTDALDVLTNGGSDSLFQLEVTRTDATIALADIQVTYHPVGGTMTVLNFAIVDNDQDVALGEGDRLTAVEPGPDLLNPSNAGQAFEIALAEKTGPNTVTQWWTGSWSAR